MMQRSIQDRLIYSILIAYAVAATFIIYYFDGTGDAGDSVSHYQFARYAPLHFELFFDHWAKPLFVLLASPFAQFGFIGMKVFNALCALLSIYFTFRIAQLFHLKNAVFVSLFLIFSPLYLILTFSGLTEPLFAMFVALALYLILKNKLATAAIILSFLPFVRSEGLIIAGIFGLYFLYKRQWIYIALLLTGHIVYSIAGYFVHGDLLWVFTKIPYSRLSSTYGSGGLFHFVVQTIYVIGIPLYLMFALGLISIVFKSFKAKLRSEMFILVFLGFLAFFAAHTLFWYFGIFNSMGLKRVMISVIPLMAIIALMGYNFITEEALKNNRKAKSILQGLLILYIIIFPFTSNPAAIAWDKDFSLSPDQQQAVKVADFLADNFNERRYVFVHPYLSEALEIDFFDVEERVDLNADYFNNMESGDIIIWENWFSVVERGIGKKWLDNHPDLNNLFETSVVDKNREIVYAVYEKK